MPLNVGVITSTRFNLHASTVVCALAAKGVKPRCVLSAEKSRFVLLRNYVKKMGYRPLIRRVLQHLNVEPSDIRIRLAEYAADNGLMGWDRSLPAVCAQLGIQYKRVDSVNADSTVRFVQSTAIDLLVNTGGDILRAPLIDATKIGVLNAHMGFLPTFRGFNVLEWSLFHGQPVGVTLHFIDPGVDTGDVSAFRHLPVDEGDTIQSLRAKSFPLNVELVTEYIVGCFGNSRPSRNHQDPEEGRQYFAMHPRLKVLAERGVRRWVGVAASKAVS